MQPEGKLYERSIFIFRRDFRLLDNVGLHKACRESKTVIPIFIFDDRQCNSEKNAYFCDATVEFMVESLDLLDKDLQSLGSRLIYFYGTYPDIIDRVLDEIAPECVYVNEDYTPFSIKRDQEIKDHCTERAIAFSSSNDIMLMDKGKVLKKDGSFYTEFMSYFFQASKYPVERPVLESPTNFISKDEQFKSEFREDTHRFYKPAEGVVIRAGRGNGLKILISMINFAEYPKTRSFADKPTTQISTYLKYGNVSIREVYWAIADALGKKHDLLRQLFWRDFYYNILYFFPDAIFDAYWVQFRELDWPKSDEWFEAWKAGNTGFPLIDASMRCLLHTHYLPNALRLSLSNFLAKVLGLDWRLGQRWFANQLLDYDLALNNGGWQWSASTGAVCQPHTVVFNPWVQSESMDKDGSFIKKWIPELKDVSVKEIHKWYDNSYKYRETGYPAPIVNFEERKAEVIAWYTGLYTKDHGDAVKKIHNRELPNPDVEMLKEDMFENEMDEEVDQMPPEIDDF